MKLSVKEKFVASLIILTAMLCAVAIGSFYMPAGITLSAVALALGGYAFDGLSEEQQVYRTSLWLLPSVGLSFVAAIACLIMLLDVFSWIASLVTNGVRR